MEFKVYGEKLERVESFKYLGRILTQNDDDTMCIEANLRNARSKWNNISKILKRAGACAKTMAQFYSMIVQAVLLYGAESWTINERNYNKLRSFHKRAMRYMTGQHIRKKEDGNWEYPNHEKLMKLCNLSTIDEYIKRRRGTLWRLLTEERKELWESIQKLTKPARDPHKVLWWNQKYISKDDMKRCKI